MRCKLISVVRCTVNGCNYSVLISCSPVYQLRYLSLKCQLHFINEYFEILVKIQLSGSYKAVNLHLTTA